MVPLTVEHVPFLMERNPDVSVQIVPVTWPSQMGSMVLGRGKEKAGKNSKGTGGAFTSGGFDLPG